jgi:hypothetical protein
MEQVKKTLVAVLVKFRKLILLVIIGIAGLLLTLAGFGLITLSPDLIKYSGMVLLVLTAILYFLL